ncbi:MAG: flippase-like domain-containing protein [Candidatus Omnitrophica bacterium]|nr:flippase-like domain-containing protein [Candidatus Omnitrophota bacterium]
MWNLSKAKIGVIIKIAITGCGVLLIVYMLRDKFDDVFAIIKNCNIMLFLASLFITISSNIISAARLQCVFRMQDIRMSLRKTWKLYYIGYYFNIFLPTSIGGDIAKGYYAFKYCGKKANSFIAVVIDRFIGLCSIVFLSVISIIISYRKIDSPVIPAIIIGIIIVGSVVLLFFTNKKIASFLNVLNLPIFSEKIIKQIKNLYQIIYECKKHKLLVLRAFLYSIVFQMIIIATVYLNAIALNIDLSLSACFLVMPLVFVFSMVPSINGLGIREGAYIYFFGIFTSPENAFSLAILGDITLYSLSVVGLICYIYHKEGIAYKEIKGNTFDMETITMNTGGKND